MENKTNEYSERVSALRFPLIIGVVFIHAHVVTLSFANRQIDIEQVSYLAALVQNLISEEIARSAVPTFFLVSGFLFFRNFVWSTNNFVAKLKSRIRTLLLPFLFWNLGTILLMVLLQLLPPTKVYFSGDRLSIDTFCFADYVKALFGIGRFPIAYQFWFVRDLMLLALAAPAISLSLHLHKMIQGLLLAILFAFWLFGGWPFYAPSAEATLFFFAGCLLAVHSKTLFIFDRFGKTSAIAYGVLVIASAWLKQTDFHRYLHQANIVFGVVTILFATSIAVKSAALKRFLLNLSSASFFVFATHEILLLTMQKATYRHLQASPWLITGCYFGLPIIATVVLVWLYRMLLKSFPALTLFITGGRAEPRHAVLRPVFVSRPPLIESKPGAARNE